MLTKPIRFWVNTLLVLSTAATLAACGSDAEGSTAAASETEPVTLRLGFFPNVTHAPALVGIHDGLFAEALGENVRLETVPFNAGSEAIESLFADAIDATFIGPNPAINAFAQSGGEAIRIVAGTTSGGAFLVVSPEIAAATDLAGKALATPQLGNTQDVALRSWLLDQGYETDTAQGGDVSVVPQANADTLNAFKQGDIDGAWVPEPWATRLILEGGGKVLVDERDLWPEGEYVTTHLIVATGFLEDHPATVRSLIEGLVDAIDATNADPASAQASVNAVIGEVTDKPLPDEVITGAWQNLTFTFDPVASSLQRSAEDAVKVELLQPVELDGIYDLTILNEVLTARGKEEVKGL
jgi:NitT/TauT family transport system substrate-binding protein